MVLFPLHLDGLWGRSCHNLSVYSHICREVLEEVHVGAREIEVHIECHCGEGGQSVHMRFLEVRVVKRQGALRDLSQSLTCHSLI
jgi:hypothetical protein